MLSTLFAQVSDSLPKTSYLKLMDIWFLFSIVYSFMIIILHVLIDYFHKYNNPGEVAQFETDLFRPTLKNTSRIDVASTSSNKSNVIFKRCDPYFRSKLVNKIGLILTTISYILFMLIFWIVAFQQKIQEDSKVFKADDTVAVGYPD